MHRCYRFIEHIFQTSHKYIRIFAELSGTYCSCIVPSSRCGLRTFKSWYTVTRPFCMLKLSTINSSCWIFSKHINSQLDCYIKVHGWAVLDAYDILVTNRKQGNLSPCTGRSRRLRPLCQDSLWDVDDFLFIYFFVYLKVQSHQILHFILGFVKLIQYFLFWPLLVLNFCYFLVL
jgi:hypothetical protein